MFVGSLAQWFMQDQPEKTNKLMNQWTNEPKNVTKTT
jgi:hypothetical protein